MKLMTTLLLLAAADQEVDRRLDTRISVDFRGESLSEAIDVVRGATGLNIIVAEGGETPVRAKLLEVRARSLLKLILEVNGLMATLDGEAIVVRFRRCRGTALRVYDVRGLLAKIEDFPGPRIELGHPSRERGLLVMTLEYFPPPRVFPEDLLLDLVRTHTGGRSWNDVPGASMTYRDGLLYVTQTRDVHREIGDLLSRLGL